MRVGSDFLRSPDGIFASGLKAVRIRVIRSGVLGLLGLEGLGSGGLGDWGEFDPNLQSFMQGFVRDHQESGSIEGYIVDGQNLHKYMMLWKSG